MSSSLNEFLNQTFWMNRGIVHDEQWRLVKFGEAVTTQPANKANGIQASGIKHWGNEILDVIPSRCNQTFSLSSFSLLVSKDALPPFAPAIDTGGIGVKSSFININKTAAALLLDVYLQDF